ncbi:hypothetical protein [Rhizobium sp. RAF56]|uniref:hypothetical protein n=1 Tax=Rhizobium sp. RAF56 TaxID=3233062 RepID=UPI003F95ACDF
MGHDVTSIGSDFMLEKGGSALTRVKMTADALGNVRGAKSMAAFQWTSIEVCMSSRFES